jgi:hypothetical protein
MPGGFASRFAIEAGFLLALGVGAGIADLRSVVIVALLAGGWVLVSLIELAVWNAEGRTVTRRVPPAPPVEPQPEPESEPEPEPEVGWPLERDHEDEDESYPLRPDAEFESDEGAEAYTRVLGGQESAAPQDGERS